MTLICVLFLTDVLECPVSHCVINCLTMTRSMPEVNKGYSLLTLMLERVEGDNLVSDLKPCSIVYTG